MMIPPVCLPRTTPSSQGAFATMTSLINCHILHGWFSVSAYLDQLLGAGRAEDPSGLARQRMMESGSFTERSSQPSGPFEQVVPSFREGSQLVRVLQFREHFLQFIHSANICSVPAVS